MMKLLDPFYYQAILIIVEAGIVGYLIGTCIVHTRKLNIIATLVMTLVLLVTGLVGNGYYYTKMYNELWHIVGFGIYGFVMCIVGFFVTAYIELKKECKQKKVYDKH